MKTLEFIKLNESGANNVVASLQQLLADFQVYYTNLRGFHWNIKGHDFFVLHSQFEKMYDDTAEKVDEIAERILMLGGTPANKFSDYLKVANISEVDKVSNGEQALNNILQSISYLIGEERKILRIALNHASQFIEIWIFRIPQDRVLNRSLLADHFHFSRS